MPPTTLVLSTPWLNTPTRGVQELVPPAPSLQVVGPLGDRRGVVRSRSLNSWRLIPTSLLRARIARSFGTLSKYRPQFMYARLLPLPRTSQVTPRRGARLPANTYESGVYVDVPGVKIRLVTPKRVMFCVPNGRVKEPAPSTASVDIRTPALTVTRGRICQVSCTKPPISVALVGGSSGPRPARMTRNRLALS